MSIKIRAKTCDVAFAFRMGAGFPGDVNRSSKFSVEPAAIHSAAPPVAYGQPVLIDGTSQGARPFTTGDQSDTAASGYGVTVRPFPFQQSSGSNFGEATLGAAVPPATGAIDVLRSGYIIGKLPAGQTSVKGGLVYVWCTASAGANVQGAITSVFDAGDTTRLANATFNGSPDANGNVEIAFNI